MEEWDGFAVSLIEYQSPIAGSVESSIQMSLFTRSTSTSISRTETGASTFGNLAGTGAVSGPRSCCFWMTGGTNF